MNTLLKRRFDFQYKCLLVLSHEYHYQQFSWCRCHYQYSKIQYDCFLWITQPKIIVVAAKWPAVFNGIWSSLSRWRTTTSTVVSRVASNHATTGTLLSLPHTTKWASPRITPFAPHLGAIPTHTVGTLQIGHPLQKDRGRIYQIQTPNKLLYGKYTVAAMAAVA